MTKICRDEHKNNKSSLLQNKLANVIRTQFEIKLLSNTLDMNLELYRDGSDQIYSYGDILVQNKYKTLWFCFVCFEWMLCCDVVC